ncbi:MAG: hypothetical protein ABI894_17760 [Ilumatobacteraceae bacterium]
MPTSAPDRGTTRLERAAGVVLSTGVRIDSTEMDHETHPSRE